ncbi:necrosis inducing-like protein NPP1 type [Phytophthora sojae]|uniref:Necrosis inducing-like protein NPP1 type n=1 Tax=Phytophthora sojae (strain P6497) TaxID=1094619 RepID=G5A8N9_PHYSP|nr:necrosis inducing-like protein NPP1 type [Phytophthora sojae]EGZ08265.1 necrosis inducing-like protein NPP1 type [Phytophthora sojae]|eukprot:XP_009536437.1 necrosis inducing-like protein NPP1 type [Phytophthora sojae]
MNFRAFLFAAIASLVVVKSEVKMIGHDQVQPFAQPEPTTESEKSAVKYKPQLHISYGCHPYPAVQADGSVNGGLKWTFWSWADSDCKGSGLGSQVYSRSDWHRGKWAIVYAWYFPKGRDFEHSFKRGHRHYWLYAILWTDSPNPDTSTILGVSVPNGFRDKSAAPDAQFVIDGKTIKFDSYRSFTTGRQDLGLTEKTGDTQDLITWEQLTEEARTALSNMNFDGPRQKIVVPMKDGDFAERLARA